LIGRLLLSVLLLLPATLWGAAAIVHRLPDARLGIAALFTALMALATRLLWQRRPLAMLAVIVPVWALLLGWWATILPSQDRDWQPDVAKVATARIDGDTLTVTNVRNFNWRSDTDFDPRWETRQYHVDDLRGADLFLSYWAGERVAHAIISFDFGTPDPLALSIEIRREQGEAFSSIAGFFKTYELIAIAADERDIVKVRSTVRGEDVRIFRLDIAPATARGLLGEYVTLINDLAAEPRWYHTLTANCTTVIFGMARRLDPRIRLDWRVLLPGKLPAYLQENDFVSRAVPLEALVAAGRIGPRAAAPPPDPDFSNRIRKGVPHPAA
jgi:hypothetical protein